MDQPAGQTLTASTPVAPLTRSDDSASVIDDDAAIRIEHATKTYRGRVRALRDVALTVHRSEIFGLLGPNGAGKSTLVKILMTVIRPDRIQGHMLGRRVGHKPTLARVGYLPENHRFPEHLTGRQVLEFFAALSDVDALNRDIRADALLELVGLSAWQHRRVKQYSKGMRQRLGLAQALMHDPDLILLDEPTDGVDPVGRRDIREILLELKRRGKTIFLNSHLLSELEQVCDRAAIMVRGAIVQQGTIGDLSSYGRRYEIEVAAPSGGEEVTGSDILAAVASVGVVSRERRAPNPDWQPADPTTPVHFGTVSGAVPVEIDGVVVKVGTDDPALIQPLLDALRRKLLVVKSIRAVRPSLEDLFMRAVTDSVTGHVMPPGAAPIHGSASARKGSGR
jgi:ABC-2 type transport system ATP-binding protein